MCKVQSDKTGRVPSTCTTYNVAYLVQIAYYHDDKLVQTVQYHMSKLVQHVQYHLN